MLKMMCTGKDIEVRFEQSKVSTRKVEFYFFSQHNNDAFSIVFRVPTEAEINMYEVGQTYVLAPSGQVA